MGGSSSLTTSKALDIAKENNEVPSHVSQFLDSKKNQIWAKIQHRPTSYVLSMDEYKVMNYFSQSYNGNRQYADAIARFWKNFKGDPALVDGAGSSSNH